MTDAAGLREAEWGAGCLFADFDDDGDPDLFVSNFGPDVLYRNNGDGTFTDVSSPAGVHDPRWGEGAAAGISTPTGFSISSSRTTRSSTGTRRRSTTATGRE